MAPLACKRALPPEPPDAGNRVSKTKALSSESTTNVKLTRLAAYSAEALRKAEAIEKALCVSECSTDKTTETDEDIMDETVSVTSDNAMGSETPRVTATPDQTRNIVSTEKIPDIFSTSPKENREPGSPRGSTDLMCAIKGLLDLTNQYLQDLEKNHPGVGLDFLALLADGASRAMQGKRVCTSQTIQRATQEKNKSR